MRDLDIFAGTTETNIVVPVSVTASALIGVSFDAQQYGDGIGQVIASILNTAGTLPTLTIKVQDSADNSSFADASPALAFAQATTTGVMPVLALDFSKLRRYVQLYATIGGTNTPAFTVGAAIVARKKYL